MLHAKALRLIGQALEAARVPAFKVEKKATDYRLWIGTRQTFSFSPADILRLDAQAQRKRRAIATNSERPRAKLSQQLRALGLYLDRMDVGTFGIVWTNTNAILSYQSRAGVRYHRALTNQELNLLAQAHSRQRSGRYAFLGIDT